VYWGTHIKAVLKALDVATYEVHTSDDLPVVAQAIQQSFRTNLPVVVLISPELWECTLPDAFLQLGDEKQDFLKKPRNERSTAALSLAARLSVLR